ncbi:uncharacterized protein [Vulpes vulpes]|uniref:Basic proline-rich protein-like n=1 Tax=Vulpes vulpes TaxID=9627 RepID=A0ABM4XKK6_VULVU
MAVAVMVGVVVMGVVVVVMMAVGVAVLAVAVAMVVVVVVGGGDDGGAELGFQTEAARRPPAARPGHSDVPLWALRRARALRPEQRGCSERQRPAEGAWPPACALPVSEGPSPPGRREPSDQAPESSLQSDHAGGAKEPRGCRRSRHGPAHRRQRRGEAGGPLPGSQPGGHSQRARPDDPPGALGLRGATAPAPPAPERPGLTSQGGAMPLSAPAPRGRPRVGVATSCRPRAPPSPPWEQSLPGTRGLQPAVWGQVASAPTHPPSPSRAFWAPHPQGPTTWRHLPGRQRASRPLSGSGLRGHQGIPPPSHPARPLAAPPCWSQPVPHLPPPGPPPGEPPSHRCTCGLGPHPCGSRPCPSIEAPLEALSAPIRQASSDLAPADLLAAPGGRPAAASPGLGPLG